MTWKTAMGYNPFKEKTMTEQVRDWHSLSFQEACNILGTDHSKGLSDKEVFLRREKFGPNRITKKKETPAFVRFLQQFNQPLIYALLAAGAVTFWLHEYVDSAVIFGVVIVNAIVGFVQESKAVDSLSALARSMVTYTTVIRDGQQKKLSSEELVPGDLVQLASGDKVSADMRITYSKELKSNESALTGESLPVEKQTAPLPEGTSLADRTNLLYASTLITNGAGKAVVFSTGDQTEIGKISKLVENAENIETPLTIKLAGFSKLLLYIIVAFAAMTFIVAVGIHGHPAVDAFMASVAIAVGAIPEGLPAAITIILSIGVARMAARKAIIRKLPAVETLGSTTIICSDKTGTLTENKMTVQGIYAGGKAYSVTGQGFLPVGEILDAVSKERAIAHSASPLAETLIAGLLCNDSKITEDNGAFSVEGDPTEAALLISGGKASFDRDLLGKDMPRLDSLPFESEKQYMATLHKGSGENTVYVKGSNEAILKRCSASMLIDGKAVSLDEPTLNKAAEAFASQGLRVIAFAKKILPSAKNEIGHEDISSGLIFLGFQAMMDPPRQEAIKAVKSCFNAGVLVKMITGDHVSTAKAIAEKLGIRASLTDKNEELIAVTGAQMEKWSDRDYLDNTLKTSVFARVTPEQKLKIVKSLQEQGHIVAMTGDGVNDAPALKQANIGVAMGRDGTEVAKEAADIVLTDDNFASIEAAVEEGRGVFDNLRKFIVWTIPTNLTEGMVLIIAIIFNFALPISPLQILWINMMTAVLLGMTLAFEPKEEGIMLRMPNDPKMPIFDAILTSRTLYVSALLIAGVLGLFKLELILGLDVPTAQTVAVNMLVFGELFYLFNCRSFSRSSFKIGFFTNNAVLIGITLMTAVQIAFTYLPVMNTLFGSSPIDWSAWSLIIVSSIAIYLIVEMEKKFRSAGSIKA